MLTRRVHVQATPQPAAAPPERTLLGILDSSYVHMFEPLAARLVPGPATPEGEQSANTPHSPVCGMCSRSSLMPMPPYVHGCLLAMCSMVGSGELSRTATVLAVLALLLVLQLMLSCGYLLLSAVGVTRGEACLLPGEPGHENDSDRAVPRRQHYHMCSAYWCPFEALVCLHL